MDIDFNASERLKALRTLSGLTQEQFAEHADISYKFYQHIESGRKKKVRLETIERIARAYGIQPWEFFYTQLPQLHMDVKKGVKSNMHRGKASK